MARRTSTAVAPIEPEVIGPNYTVTKVGEQQVFTLGKAFLDKLKPAAEAVGNAMIQLNQTAAQRAEIALNVTEAFNAWKKLTKGGLPQFVKDVVDSRCPHTSYGKPGSLQRKELTSFSIFTGIETMVKKGQVALKLAGGRQALLKAGIDPDDAPKVTSHRKAETTAKNKKKTKGFVACIVGFNKDVTQTSITAMLVWAGKVKRENGKLTTNLSDEGQALLDAALKELGIEALDAAGRDDDTEEEARFNPPRGTANHGGMKGETTMKQSPMKGGNNAD